MQNLSSPLTEKELDDLSDFLLNRVDETHDADPDFDCGMVDLSELDGFLTAIVSGPNVVPPSTWLPVVWGEEEPVWESVDEFQRVFSLVVRHMNSVARSLEAGLEHFEPLFNEHRVKGEAHLVVDDWCYGYMMGVALDPHAWQVTDGRVAEMLTPITLFGTEGGWKILDDLEREQADAMRNAIPQAAHDAYVYWLERRGGAQRASATARPHRRAVPKVGRNDPCPCGSGKKYKNCCLR